MNKILLFGLLLAILLEVTVTMLPITIIFLLLLAIYRRERSVFLIGFFAGVFLDIMTLHPLGQASSYFVIFLMLVYLYQRKFEIATFHFVILASFFGGLFFAMVEELATPFFLGIANAMIAGILWVVLFRVRNTSLKITR